MGKVLELRVCNGDAPVELRGGLRKLRSDAPAPRTVARATGLRGGAGRGLG
jgi:hypothetical protein